MLIIYFFGSCPIPIHQLGLNIHQPGRIEIHHLPLLTLFKLLVILLHAQGGVLSALFHVTDTYDWLVVL